MPVPKGKIISEIASLAFINLPSCCSATYSNHIPPGPLLRTLPSHNWDMGWWAAGWVKSSTVDQVEYGTLVGLHVMSLGPQAYIQLSLEPEATSYRF